MKVIEVPFFAAMLEALVRMPRVNNFPAVKFTLDDGLAPTSSFRCIHTLSAPVYDHLLKGLETIVYSQLTDSGRCWDTGTDDTVVGGALSLTGRRQSARSIQGVSRLGLNDKVTQGIVNHGHKCYAIVILHTLRYLMELNPSIGEHELLGKLRMMSLEGKASVDAKLSRELCDAVGDIMSKRSEDTPEIAIPGMEDHERFVFFMKLRGQVPGRTKVFEFEQVIEKRFDCDCDKPGR